MDDIVTEHAGSVLRVLALIHFAFRNRPDARIPAAPVGPARMHKKHLQFRTRAPIHQDPCAGRRSAG